MLALTIARCNWTITPHPLASIPCRCRQYLYSPKNVSAYLVEDRLEVGPGQVDGGGVTTGTRADDNNLGVHLLAYLAGSLGFPDAERAAVGMAVGDGRHGANFFVV